MVIHLGGTKVLNQDGERRPLKRRVMLWGEHVEIDVDQESKTVWIAAGVYKGKCHEFKRPLLDHRKSNALKATTVD
jgi:hypothetical protein